MSNEHSKEQGADHDAKKPAESKKPKYDWDDPATPPGDGPPMPRWPLFLGAAAWGGWLIFIIAMAIIRIRTTAI